MHIHCTSAPIRELTRSARLRNRGVAPLGGDFLLFGRLGLGGWTPNGFGGGLRLDLLALGVHHHAVVVGSEALRIRARHAGEHRERQNEHRGQFRAHGIPPNIDPKTPLSSGSQTRGSTRILQHCTPFLPFCQGSPTLTLTGAFLRVTLFSLIVDLKFTYLLTEIQLPHVKSHNFLSKFTLKLSALNKNSGHLLLIAER